MRRLRRWGLALAPLSIVFLSLTGLSLAAPARQTGAPPPANQCAAGTLMRVDPDRINLGQSADVTMVFTQTCVAKRKPVDLIILADESHSMVRERTSAGIATVTPKSPPQTPDPSRVPPTKTPAGPGGSGPGGGGGTGTDNSDPPGCANDIGGVVPPGGRATATPKVTPGSGPGPKPLLFGSSNADGDPDQTAPTRTPTTNPGGTLPGSTPGSPGVGKVDPEPAGSEDLLREESKFLQDFVRDPAITADLDAGQLRLGFAAFASRGRTVLTLQTGEAGKRIGSSGNRLKGEGLSRIDLGLRQAEAELIKRANSVGADPDRRKVILVLSDGAFCARDLSRAHVGKDVEVVTVFFGRGGWKRRLDKIATQGRYAFSSRELKQILDLYSQELAVSVPTRMEQLLLHDTLTPSMLVDDTSVMPPYSVHHDQRLEWWGVHPTLPLTATDWLWSHSVISPSIGAIDVTNLVTVSDRMTLTYRITPSEAGNQPISEEALAVWHESAGVDGLAVFPDVYIDVAAPTETPTSTPTNTPTSTSTATATATNTRTPEARYFPIAIRNWPEATPTPDRCPPELQRVDIALVVDASISMSDTAGGAQTKLQAAISAAKTLAGLLQLKADGSGDQAAVIGFNDNATVLAPLTGDRVAVDSALDQLPALQGPGTFIDRALQTAIDELNSPRRRPGSTRSLVLVTDGKNSGDTANVLRLADALRAANIAVFTVGLGLETDIDAGLLRSIATTPDNFRHAPTTDQLLLIYQEIARLIPCPRDRP